MKMFRAVSPIQGRVTRLVTDRGSADYEPPLPIAKNETMEFRYDGVWAVAMVAPLVEPKSGRRTFYPVSLIEVKES